MSIKKLCSMAFVLTELLAHFTPKMQMKELFLSLESGINKWLNIFWFSGHRHRWLLCSTGWSFESVLSCCGRLDYYLLDFLKTNHRWCSLFINEEYSVHVNLEKIRKPMSYNKLYHHRSLCIFWQQDDPWVEFVECFKIAVYLNDILFTFLTFWANERLVVSALVRMYNTEKKSISKYLII